MRFPRPLAIAILFMIFSAAPTRAADVFTDVSSNHPYFKAIMALHDTGVIEGYANNTFRPDQPVNRAEALKIILLGSDIFVPDVQPDISIFPDVIADVWYGKYAFKAKNLKIVNGDGDTGLFRPGDTVNLAEILKILIEANGTETRPPLKNPYADVPPEAWFSRYFDYAKTVGLLDASASGEIDPDRPVDRGLMAELLYRLSQKPPTDAYGKASYYGEIFHGRTTASGDVFDASALTAAHRTYAFNTWLKVTNLENGQSVSVRVNDRGPYAGDDRVIDLSKAAFEAIAPLSRGVITVAVEKIPTPSAEAPAAQRSDTAQPLSPAPDNTEPAGASGVPAASGMAANLIPLSGTGAAASGSGTCESRREFVTFPPRIFDGIFLTNEVPTQVMADQLLTFTGRTAVAVSEVTVFLVDDGDLQQSFSAPLENGEFSLDIPLVRAGHFRVGIVPGHQGESVVQPLTVLPNTCLKESVNETLPAPADFSPSVADSHDGNLKWAPGNYNFFQLTFAQEGQFRRVLLHDASSFQPVYAHFAGFQPGPVQVQLRGASFSGRSLAEADRVEWSLPATLTLNAVVHEDHVIDAGQVTVLSRPDFAQRSRLMTLRFSSKTDLRAEASVILPDGSIESVPLSAEGLQPVPNKYGIQVFPASGDTVFTFRFTPTSAGLHFIEVNNAEGLAAINIPVYAKDDFPLIPNFTEASPRKTADLGNDLNSLRASFLSLINRDRHAFLKSPLILDDSISALAQLRADDMTKNNYFSHWNAQGLGANDLRPQFTVHQTVAENLAKDVNSEFAQYGLMRSAIHRKNLLKKEWTRVGLGISRHSDGTYVFVQLFSEDPIDLSNLEELRRRVLDTINRKRMTPLLANDLLSTIAQSWSDRMVGEDFFDFTAADGDSVFKKVEASNLYTRLGAYLAGNTSFGPLLEQIAGNSALQDSDWAQLGVGIKQDGLGVIKVTLIYAE